MPSIEKDLQNAEAGNDPDLNFGYNDLLEELKSEFDYPPREEGDVTPRELGDVTNLTERQWYTILMQKVRAGELVRLKVKERGQTTPYYVYRRNKELL